MVIASPFLKRISLEKAPASDNYPFNIPLVRQGFKIDLTRPVTIICGENGSGKSTIIESIALKCGFNLAGGNRNHSLGKSEYDVSPLQEHLKLSWSLKVNEGFFMRAESFFQFSQYIDELAQSSGKSIYRGYGGKSLNAQSHGEAFLSLFSNRLHRKGVYIFDEPEAALSPQRQLAMLGLMFDLEKEATAQFLIATHSPIIMAYPGATLLWLEHGEFREKSFKATTHFQVMARFFADPDKYIDEFLNSDL